MNVPQSGTHGPRPLALSVVRPAEDG